LLQTFENELAVIKLKERFDEDEITMAKEKILALLTRRRRKAMTGESIRESLRLQNNVIGEALHLLSFEGAIRGERKGRATYWAIEEVTLNAKESEEIGTP